MLHTHTYVRSVQNKRKKKYFLDKVFLQVTSNNSISLAQFDYTVKFEEEYRETIASGKIRMFIIYMIHHVILRRVSGGDHDNSAQKKDQLPPATNLSSIRYSIWQESQTFYYTFISGLFVIVSWLSLFIPPESIPGRVAMAMTTLLTLAAMFGGVRQNTPMVSYVSALDIWMCGCIVFVFFTLLEYVIILWYVK